MDNHYDIVIIGGGPNGLGIACYLAKCGMSVCVCEDRMELGGGAENAEPMPGFRIDPHATYMYGAAAPGFEQLELHKYGFRMNYCKYQGGSISSDGKAFKLSSHEMEKSIEYLKRYSEKDAQLYTLFARTLYDNDLVILRSVYCTPPPP